MDHPSNQIAAASFNSPITGRLTPSAQADKRLASRSKLKRSQATPAS